MPGDYIITMVFRTDGHDISRIFAKKKKKKKKKRIHLNLHIWGGDKPDQGYSSVYMGVCIYTYICIDMCVWGSTVGHAFGSICASLFI